MSKKVLKSLLIVIALFTFFNVKSVYALPKVNLYCDPYDAKCIHTKEQFEEEAARRAAEKYAENQRKVAEKYYASTTDDDQDFSCRNANIRKAVNIVGTALFWLRILVPIVIVIVGSVSFAKAVISQDDNDIKAVFYALIKKIILGVMIFVIPTIVVAVMKNIANSQYNTDNTWAYCVELLK